MDFLLIRSKRKTLSLELKDGGVVVRAPKRASKKAIISFVESHRDWIERQKKKQEERRRATENIPPLTDEELDRLKEQAKAYFPERVRYYASLMGVSCNRVTLRFQKTRWGSCSTKKNLNFNCLLMLAPAEIRDAVIVHELCHLKEMNHSEKFYREVERILPDYKVRDQKLKEIGPLLTARLKNRQRLSEKA